MTSHNLATRSRSLATNRSGEVDVELITFMERYATNLARWDLLLYFAHNPAAQDNAQGIADQLGRRAGSLSKELDDLVYLGVLASHQNGRGMIYELARVPANRRALVRLARHHGASVKPRN